MRSLLFVPGDSEKKLEKALASGADVLIVDLEDSVAGARKDAARDIAEAFIKESRKKTSAKLYVRVNDFDSGMTDGDLAAVIGARPDGIMLPKCAGSADVVRLAVKLRVNEAEAGLPDGSTAILPIITESARALLAASTFNAPLSRLAGVTWGAEDLSADMRAKRNTSV